MDANGKVVAELAKSDLTKFEQLGLKTRRAVHLQGGRRTRPMLHGMLHFPSNFDPAEEVSAAGQRLCAARHQRRDARRFPTPNALTEYGFLVASLDSRSAGGRGKRFLDAIYMKLGHGRNRRSGGGRQVAVEPAYVDKNRVGIFGTSYGGYASAMALLRYPDVFQAASASSPVTDWRHYDTIYTERYMWTPQENKAGYDAGSTDDRTPTS